METPPPHTNAPPTAKPGYRARNVKDTPTATVPPDENAPIIRMNRKTGLVRKRTVAPSVSPPSSHALLPAP
ncbi:hypothetical protein TNCV_4058671 [Trichonephila clavipes]|nr:hypothetical protein TNCV_4058671 [Trichonephila clavipes]